MHVAAILSAKGATVEVVGPDTPVSVAVHRMASRGIGSLIVVGPGDELLGVLSERDIVRAIDRHGDGFAQLRVRDVVTSGVSATCAVADDLSEVMRRMTLTVNATCRCSTATSWSGSSASATSSSTASTSSSCRLTSSGTPTCRAADQLGAEGLTVTSGRAQSRKWTRRAQMRFVASAAHQKRPPKRVDDLEDQLRRTHDRPATPEGRRCG